MGAGGMSKNDLIGLVLSYLYAFGLLISVELTGKRLKWPQAFTRKIIHIAAGMWVWGILALFDNWYIGIIPFATFIFLNYLFYRGKVFKAMDAADSSPGTVYFAISITVLLILFWRTGGRPDNAMVAAAAIMAMTWGDAFASIFGMKYGKHFYTFFGHRRSLEGSMAMAITSFLAIMLTLILLPGSPLSPYSNSIPFRWVILSSIAGSGLATLAEAVSPAGTDNLSVPLVTGLGLYLIKILANI